MKMFYLQDFRGTLIDCIATDYQEALKGVGWTTDDCVWHEFKDITFYSIARHDSPAYLRAEIRCGAV